MYLDHFGLAEKPFELTDHPAFYYAPPHEIASISLQYAIEQEQGLSMLTGVPGTGKTTLLKRLLQIPNVHAVLLSDVAVAGRSLLAQLAHAFGIKASPDEIPLALRRFLQREMACGRRVALMLDEAQSLTRKHFAEVLFLNNLTFSGRRLIQIVLVGQPALLTKLTRPELAAVEQRIVVRSVVEALSFEEAVSYIDFRLRAAGASGTSWFTLEAVRRAHENGQGIPRRINILCERALVVAYADNASVIDRNTVDTAISDLRFDGGRSPEGSAMGENGEIREEPALRARFDRLERKLDTLLEAYARTGLVPAGFAEPLSGSWRPLSPGPRAAEDETATQPVHPWRDLGTLEDRR